MEWVIAARCCLWAARGCPGHRVPQPHVPFFKSSARISELLWRARACVTITGMFRRKNFLSQAGMFRGEGVAVFGSSPCIPKYFFFSVESRTCPCCGAVPSSVLGLQSCLPPAAGGKRGHEMRQYLGMYVFLWIASLLHCCPGRKQYLASFILQLQVNPRGFSRRWLKYPSTPHGKAEHYFSAVKFSYHQVFVVVCSHKAKKTPNPKYLVLKVFLFSFEAWKLKSFPFKLDFLLQSFCGGWQDRKSWRAGRGKEWEETIKGIVFENSQW